MRWLDKLRGNIRPRHQFKPEPSWFDLPADVRRACAIGVETVKPDHYPCDLRQEAEQHAASLAPTARKSDIRLGCELYYWMTKRGDL